MATALVTGGARGIGHAVAAALAAAGFDIAIASLETEPDAEERLSHLRALGVRVCYFSRDIGDVEPHGALIG